MSAIGVERGKREGSSFVNIVGKAVKRVCERSGKVANIHWRLGITIGV